MNAPAGARKVITRAEGVAATRARILDAVLAVITDGTVHDASMEAIAERAGVTRVTLYRTFGSKQALLEGFVLHTLAGARLDLVDAAHAEPDVRTAVRQVLLRIAGCSPTSVAPCPSPSSWPAPIRTCARSSTRPTTADGTGRWRSSPPGSLPKVPRLSGWTKTRIADSLLVLSSHEAFHTLVERRGRSVDQAAKDLHRLAAAFLVQR